MRARGIDVLQVLLLLLVEITEHAFRQHLGEPDDGVQRRPQAISSTLDLQTVLRTIVGRATQLANTDAGVIYEYDEQREIFTPRATDRLEDEIVRTLVATPIRRGEGATGRLADVREPIQLSDISATTFQTVTALGGTRARPERPGAPSARSTPGGTPRAR